MSRHKNAEPEDTSFSLTFGGGVNTRKTQFDLNPAEAEELVNMRLDIDRNSLTPRPPFVKMADLDDNSLGVPSVSGQKVISIIPYPPRGNDFYSSAFLVQMSGGKILLCCMFSYNQKWQTFDTGHTVNTDAILSGGYESYSSLDDRLIITDITKTERVRWVRVNVTNGGFTVDWDTLPHNLSATDFFAAHCFIERERAWFADIKTVGSGGTSDTPHMVVGSAVADVTTLSISDRPSSAIGVGDPFFLLSPDLKQVEGMISTFSSVLIATQRGKTFILSGSTSEDFYFTPFFPGSGVENKQSMAYAGNDILLYREGKIDTLAGIEAFGDVQNDDLTRPIAPELLGKPPKDPDGFPVVAFDSSLFFHTAEQTIHLCRQGDPGMWVNHKSFRDQQAKDVSLLRQGDPVSGWVRWEDDDVLDTFSSNAPAVPVLKNASLFIYNNKAGFNSGRGSFVDTFLIAPGDHPTVYYLDVEHRDTDLYQKDTYSTHYLDAVKDNFTCSYKSKIVEAPSGKGITEMTGRITYVPRDKGIHTSDVDAPDVTVTVYLTGKRDRDIVRTVRLLRRSDLNDVAAGNIDTSPRSVSFSFPLGGAEYLQIGISFAGDQLIEILKVDCNVKA